MKFGQGLIQAGLINRAQLDAGLRHQANTGQLLGEALLELGHIGENELLRFLAQKFNTRYVSTSKLAHATLDSSLMDLIPLKLAEEHLLFPILLAKDKQTIGIVSCEPQDKVAIQEARIVSGMERVQVYVARREAIRALIRKHYRGDIHAFDALETQGVDDTPPDTSRTDRALVDDSSPLVLIADPDGTAGPEQEETLPTPTSITFSGVGSSQGSVLSGSLEGKKALSLIRALVAKKRTGQLGLRIGEQKGEIFFEDGLVFQAVLGEMQGEEAFLELASWEDCVYRFDADKPPRSRVIKTSTAKLLRIAALPK